MSHKQWRQLTIWTMHLAQALLRGTQGSGDSRSFAKFCLEDRENSIQPSEIGNDQSRAIIKADALITTWEVAQEVNVSHPVVTQHLKQIGKVKKLDKWVSHELVENQTKSSFWSVVSYCMYATVTHFSIRLWHITKRGSYDNQYQPTQWWGWEEARSTSMEKRSWPKFGCLLLVWSTTAFWILAKSLHPRRMLSKSTRSMQTAVAAAGIGQQKGPSFSPQQCPTARHTTNASKVKRIGLWSFASSVIFIWPLANQLLFLQASWQLFIGKTLPQPAGGRKMPSKSLLNPLSIFPERFLHTWIKYLFLIGKKKKKCWL